MKALCQTDLGSNIKLLAHTDFFAFEQIIIIIIIIFLGRHMEGLRLGLNQSCSRQPVPQPQPHRIQAETVTYTTAHGNAGSLPMSEARDRTHILMDPSGVR